MIEPQPRPMIPISTHIGGWLFRKGMASIARPLSERQVACSRVAPNRAAIGAMVKAATKAIAL